MKTSRVSFAAALAAGSVLLLSGTAFAHVSVQPAGEAAQGGYATINFKVPNERDNASTNKLEISFPTEHPLTSAMPQDIPGWTVNVEKTKLDKPLTVHGKQINEAVSKITWSGGKIEPGRFQQFPVSVGKLPENADTVVFKAIQTYDNNEVVRWIEETKEGAEEPQNPAPVLKLTPAKGDDHHAGGDSGKNTDAKNDKQDAHGKDEQADGHDKAAESSSDTTARALGITGIVVGLGGVAFGVASRRRTS
ncbi:YcnI family protein [Streptomyces sp. NPDC051211]|uniref:YcnI family copper-binding membrane protein n=1 Tax=Streptomyces sp. NPDC051211 TaxID=3154643 RepID=UPI00344EB5A2